MTQQLRASTNCSPRVPELYSQHTYGSGSSSTMVCNFSSRESNAIFWPLQAPGIHIQARKSFFKGNKCNWTNFFPKYFIPVTYFFRYSFII